jgi:hypothetical protein
MRIILLDITHKENMTKNDREKTEVEKVYLHVGNSGVTFQILDYYGPTVSITSSSFGNLNQKFEFFTTKEGLKELRDAIDRSLQHEFSEDYCHAAEAPRPANEMSRCGFLNAAARFGDGTQ